MIGSHTPASPETFPNPGAQAWELLWELLRASKPYMEGVAGRFDLTPQQMGSLKTLSHDKPMAMSALASMLGCDASNVTAIVDRLEDRGLVDRRSAPHDRRVKELVLTVEGARVKERIHNALQLPPPTIANLSVVDQVALRDILRRALDAVAEERPETRV